MEKISIAQDIRNGILDSFASKRVSIQPRAAIITAMPNQYNRGMIFSTDSPKSVDGVTLTPKREPLAIAKPKMLISKMMNVSFVAIFCKNNAVLLRKNRLLLLLSV